MLLRNGRSIFQNPGVYSGAISAQTGSFVKGGLRNRQVGGFSETFGGHANGHLAPSSFALPTKPGSISSYTEAATQLSQGVILLTPALPMNVSGTLTLTLTNATLDQIVALVASGNLSLLVANASLSSAVSASAAGSATISVNVAQLGGIIPVSAESTMVLLSSVQMSALAGMIAEAGGPTPLSPEGLAQAVWNAALADFAESGTTGKALADAGGAGNPWAALLASNKDPGTFGEHVQKLLKKSLFLGES
jgi:hypothetical protein